MLDKLKSGIFILALIWGALLVVRATDFYQAACFNLASLALSHWAFEPQLPRARNCLSEAMYWGEKSGSVWAQRGYETRTRALWSRVTDASVVSRQRAKDVYQQGQVLEGQGKSEAALGFYERAVAADEKCIRCQYAIYRLAVQQGKDELAQQQQDVLSRLHPRYSVSVTLWSGVRLLGYDLNEFELERDLGPILITLYWEMPQGGEGISKWEADGWHYVETDRRLFQIGYVDNLLPNGGFERNLSSIAELPSGYVPIGIDLSRNPREWSKQYELTQCTRGLESSYVIAMISAQDRLNGITVFPYPKVEPGSYYIYSGWIHTTDGSKAYLGGLWLASDRTHLRYSYVAKGQAIRSWQHRAECFKAPAQSTNLMPLIFKKNPGGVVYFDDLFLFELPLPVFAVNNE